MMMSRREYAVSLGLAEHKRGRMPETAWDAIKQAEASGQKFTDSDQPYPNPRGIRKPGDRKVKIGVPAPVPVPPRKVIQKPVQKTVVEPSKPFTGKYEAVMPDGKRKALSDRTACRCGASLSYCRCRVPTVGLLIVDPLADDTDATVNVERV